MADGTTGPDFRESPAVALTAARGALKWANTTWLGFAGSGSTTVSIAGYQTPSFEQASDISLTSSASANLLRLTWTFAPAAVGTDSYQYSDGLGAGTNALDFGAVVPGDYDTYSQTIPTVSGDTYTLHFLFTQDDTGPSGFQVSASNASLTSPTPEPGFYGLLALGLGGLVTIVNRRRKSA
jgi:hypothetical protein